MIPLVSSQVMRECDARASALHGVQYLVRRAGVELAHVTHEMLGSLYSRRICVVAGPGLNGQDGREAAKVLRGRGCRVAVVEVSSQPNELRGYDLVIDAAFGLGCSRPYLAPRVSSATLVLAVDLPSGVDADTGALLGQPMRADVTLALGALKFAHVDGESVAYLGGLRFADLGIETPRECGLVEDKDLLGFVRERSDDHKWVHAVSVLAGSPKMPGAPALVSSGAMSAGASMVQVESRGTLRAQLSLPTEVVRFRDSPLDPRSRCVVAGPGLGESSGPWLTRRLENTKLASVLDADALTINVVSIPHDAPRILTPHAGEFRRLSETDVGVRRIEAVRRLARDLDCVVLLKGPLTIVAEPSGRLRIVNSGTRALATAGTGDVLAGMIGAALTHDHDALSAAALSAHLHGRAGAQMAPHETASALPRYVRHQLHLLGETANATRTMPTGFQRPRPRGSK